MREAFPESTIPRYVILDRDGKYGEVVPAALRNMGVRIVRTAFRAPWQNPSRKGSWDPCAGKASAMDRASRSCSSSGSIPSSPPTPAATATFFRRSAIFSVSASISWSVGGGRGVKTSGRSGSGAGT
ncbi:MAG: hypothetical protein ABIJ56_00135, partial [Pseudomonadota bacterium]